MCKELCIDLACTQKQWYCIMATHGASLHSGYTPMVEGGVIDHGKVMSYCVHLLFVIFHNIFGLKKLNFKDWIVFI